MPTDTHLPTVHMTLPSGDPVRVRPLSPTDRDRLAEGFLQLSESARYQRFFTPVSRLSNRDLAYLTDLDHVDHFAWGVESVDGEGVAVARYVRLGAGVAEAAFTVADRYQNLGLGRRLFQALAAVAALHGFARFEMTMLADNVAMARLAGSMGAAFDPPVDGTVRCEVALEERLWADLPHLEEFLRLAGEAAGVEVDRRRPITR